MDHTKCKYPTEGTAGHWGCISGTRVHTDTTMSAKVGIDVVEEIEREVDRSHSPCYVLEKSKMPFKEQTFSFPQTQGSKPEVLTTKSK